MGYSLQCRLKSLQDALHPDRNNLFRYTNRCAKVFLYAGYPVISVDEKKNELVGDFANAGRVYRPQGDPNQVRIHDSPWPSVGQGLPFWCV